MNGKNIKNNSQQILLNIIAIPILVRYKVPWFWGVGSSNYGSVGIKTTVLH
ncbi:MAG: hypothetical protein SWX82_09600 [Cyanobacteriota bacterium]|nr:hypothetical protein [Cyanobacteriota bacterium]